MLNSWETKEEHCNLEVSLVHITNFKLARAIQWSCLNKENVQWAGYEILQLLKVIPIYTWGLKFESPEPSLKTRNVVPVIILVEIRESQKFLGHLVWHIWCKTTKTTVKTRGRGDPSEYGPAWTHQKRTLDLHSQGEGERPRACIGRRDGKTTYLTTERSIWYHTRDYTLARSKNPSSRREWP